jgi:hypothetical protein
VRSISNSLLNELVTTRTSHPGISVSDDRAALRVGSRRHSDNLHQAADDNQRVPESHDGAATTVISQALGAIYPRESAGIAGSAAPSRVERLKEAQVL